jgi:anti-sigma factor RsiW
VATCNEIDPLLGAFEDGELEPHEMHEVARHLARCDECEAALRDFAGIGRRLRDAVSEPALEGFAASVMEKIGEIRLPLRTRIHQSLDALNQRWIAGLTLTSAALALGAWATILVMPNARQILTAHRDTPTQASITRPAVNAVNVAAKAAGNVIDASSDTENGGEQTAEAENSGQGFGVGAGADPGGPTVISRLEAEAPSVAVWNEPESRTTVIWMPDDASGN